MSELQGEPAVDVARPPSVCVVGSGWEFTSGISYYTCRVTRALAPATSVSTILMRRLIPRRLYPGADRVGTKVNDVDYPDGVPVFDGVDWHALPSLLQAVRFLREQDPDVVLFQWWTGAVLHSYLVLAAAARRNGAKVVVEFHEVQDTGELRTRGAGRYVDTVGRRFLRRADGFIVHSEHDRAAVAESFGITGHVRTVPHGPFDHHGSAASVGPVVGGDVTRLLFFGTIRPYKGLEDLVAAFNGLSSEQAARFELAVVGETWEGWTEPLRLIEASPHRSRITLVNRYVTDEEVTRAFAASDAVVLPYKRSSASGPLHIAMALGLPVVLTDVGGLRQGAEGYDGVTWVPPSDPEAIRAALLELPARRGQVFHDPRSWEHTADQVLQLARDVLA